MRVTRLFKPHFGQCVSVFVSWSVCLSICPSICPFVCLSVHPSIGPSVHPSENCFEDIFNVLRTFPTISSPSKHFRESACSSVCLSVCLSSFSGKKGHTQPWSNDLCHAYPVIVYFHMISINDCCSVVHCVIAQSVCQSSPGTGYLQKKG